MTWNEFKKHVDLILWQKGKDGNEQIHNINISFPECKEIGVEGYGYKEIDVCVHDHISLFN